MLWEWRASPTATPAPQIVPSPAKLEGDGRSPRSITAGKERWFCPGSTGRTTPQPWIVPGFCIVSPSSKLTPQARPNKSFQLILGQSLAHQDSPLFGSFCLLRGYFRAMTALPPQGSEKQPLPNPSLTPCTVSSLLGLRSWGTVRFRRFWLMEQGHPCTGWWWSALPITSLAALLLLSSQKITGCLFGRKSGGRMYEWEGPVRVRRARASQVGPRSWAAHVLGAL